MIDEKKKKKNGLITEDDTVPLIQRYSPSTILTLVQEVYQMANAKIDWKAIVKKTSTGISNPREYQLLWRHLAYRDPLLEKIDGDEPMDDDSDLEFELESDPSANAEVRSQAAAFLKGLKPPSFPIEGSLLHANPSETELTAHSASRKKSFRVSLDKQRESTELPNERSEGNEIVGKRLASKKRKGTGSEENEIVGVCLTAKKKRKLWTEEEDTDLIAAVKKNGEGNWMNILKGDFKHDRTASQISKRWSLLKKKLTNSNTSVAKNSISLAKSEALDAARVALNSALKMPLDRSSSSLIVGSRKTSITTSSLIKTAAVAAGGRMVAPSDAISLFKAVQSRNTVHVRAGGSKLASSTSSKLQQSPGCFTLPPPNGDSLSTSNGNAATNLRTNSASNGEKTSGKRNICE